MGFEDNNSTFDNESAVRRNGMTRRSFVALGAGALGATALMGLAGCSSGGSSSASSSSSASTAKSHTVNDIKGEAVELPTEINSIVDLWHAHNQIVLMLGAGDKLVGTTQNFKNMKWASVVYPRLPEVETLVTGSGSSQEVNYEEIVNLNPDVIFASANNMVTECRNRGLPILNVMFQDYEGLRDDVSITAEALGGDAKERAQKWEDILDENIDLVAERMKNVADADKPKVLHIVNKSTLTNVDGTNCIVDEWIKLAGGVNAIQKEGNMIDVTMEDIIAADPDVIIVGSVGAGSAVSDILSNAEWSGIKAVQNQAVYPNPTGVFAWDRYSGEEALQVLWAAKKLNPDKFSDIDMAQKTKEFYKTFYNFDLTDDQANRIVNAQDPA